MQHPLFPYPPLTPLSLSPPSPSPAQPHRTIYITFTDVLYSYPPIPPVGILVNGALLYNHTPSPSFDSCFGHVDIDHRYHYHSTPLCLLRALGIPVPPTHTLSLPGNETATPAMAVDAWPDTGPPSPLVGYALDGFPIFGPYDNNGRLAIGSSLPARANVDACNGRKDATGTGGYRYFMTPNAPFVVGCFVGTKGIVVDRGLIPSSKLGEVSQACPSSALGSHYWGCANGSKTRSERLAAAGAIEVCDRSTPITNGSNHVRCDAAATAGDVLDNNMPPPRPVVSMDAIYGVPFAVIFGIAIMLAVQAILQRRKFIQFHISFKNLLTS